MYQLSRILLAILPFLFFGSCKKSFNTEIYTQEFIIDEGFEIELLAAEPLLKSPVAMDFDLKGRIWTVELTGYMRDVEGSDEDLPDGRISFLIDTNGDGVMDQKNVFLDELVLPRAIKCYNGGLLYAEPPNLWWVPINDDDKPGIKLLVDSMYTNGGNVEHMPNGLLYNVDNWIYNAKSDRRYRWKNGKWEIKPTVYRGQWGITNDELGRLFYNTNSHPLFGDHVLPNSFDQNPFLDKLNVYNQNIAITRKFYPYQPTAVNRGYQEGVLMPDGKVSMFTSACSPLIYKGGTFGAEYEGDAFVCGPEANLVKRYKMSTDSGLVTAVMTDTITEFLVSREETFRPVNLYDGPDGNMYVVDMRKGLIQHRAYLTTYLIDLFKKKGLDKFEDGGRLYKISKKGYRGTIKDYSQLSISQWIQLLGSEIYWERIKAQEYLVLQGNESIADQIRKKWFFDNNDHALFHGLWALNGMNHLTKDDVINILENQEDTKVLSAVLYLLGPYLEKFNHGEIQSLIKVVERHNNSEMDLIMANVVGQLLDDKFIEKWGEMAIEYGGQTIYEEALVSGLQDEEDRYSQLLKGNKQIHALLKKSEMNRSSGESQLPELNFEDVTDPRTKGLSLYHQICASCHGKDGKGLESVGPPLYESPFLNGPSEHLVLIALQGLEGPLVMDDIEYSFAAAMPGIKDNPALSDEDIRDILLWIRNSFSSSHESITTEMVEELRNMVKDRKELFSQPELEAWQPSNQLEKNLYNIQN